MLIPCHLINRLWCTNVYILFSTEGLGLEERKKKIYIFLSSKNSAEVTVYS